MTQNERAKEITKISVKNIVLNFMLACAKISAGLFSDSLAVLSDGLNSLSDVATTVVVMISSHFTKVDKDKEHQYGHEKIESIATMLIAVFLGAIAAYTIYESISRLFHRSTITISYFALISTLVSAGVKYFMYRSTGSKAKQINSDALSLVAFDFRFDVFLSCSVFVGVLLAMLGLWFFEPVAAVFASVLLLVSAAKFLGKSINQLIDRAADDKTTEIINQAILSCGGVCRIDLLMTRLHGNSIYVDVEISVNADITVREGHSIAESVHDKLENELDFRIKHCNVHINPYLDSENI